MKRAALGLLTAALLACFAVGCGDDERSSDSAPNAGDAPSNASPDPNAGSSSGGAVPDGQNAQQAIEEADIIQLQDGRLYTISKAGLLSVIDVSKPGQLTLSSQLLLPGQPFEMYLNGSRLVLLMNDARIDSVSGVAALLVLDVRDPVLVQRVGTSFVSGTIADSRLQGDLLYLATDVGVTSFDVSVPTPYFQRGELPLDRGHHSVIFGNGRMYVGGQDGIDVIDVSDATGKLEKGAHVVTAGPITERWQMSEKDEVLRVVSQAQFQMPTVETFTVWNARSMQPMGKTEIHLPVAEDLKAVRFDADRAYFITFRQTDPLFIVDLSQPMQPVLRGSLTMPGYIVHLEPRGNRLVGLGVDPTNREGSINVSYFDVTNMDSPRMISRVSFGVGTNLAEDQDRLQKAFRIGEDGLITVPYSPPEGRACETGGAIQLVKIDNDTLYKGQSIPMAGNPRRALVSENELVGVSDSHVIAFDLASGKRMADVTIGQCEIRGASASASAPPVSQNRGQDYYGDHYYDDDYRACSTTMRPSSRWAGAVLGLGLVVGALARRRASRARA